MAIICVGAVPWSVSIGDLNMDGKPDLAVANYNSNDVSILLNQSASAPAKATILAEPGGEQVVSSKDDSHSAFGCGSIDLHSGSGPGDPGSASRLIPLPLILRLWQGLGEQQKISSLLFCFYGIISQIIKEV